MLAYSAILEGKFHLNTSSFSITLDLLSVSEASESESVVESLLETFDYEEGDFLFLFCPERVFLLLVLSISSESELEDAFCLLFLGFLFCLSTFLFGVGFAIFASPTTFSAGSSGYFSPPCLIIEFTTRRASLVCDDFLVQDHYLNYFVT